MGEGSWRDKERKSLSLRLLGLYPILAQPHPSQKAQWCGCSFCYSAAALVCPARPEETCPTAFSSKGKGLKSAERSGACQF